jgi:hypothetical protein
MTTPQITKMIHDFGLSSKRRCVGFGMSIGLTIGVLVGKTATGVDLNTAIALGITAGTIFGIALFTIVSKQLKSD